MLSEGLRSLTALMPWLILEFCFVLFHLDQAGLAAQAKLVRYPFYPAIFFLPLPATSFGGSSTAWSNLELRFQPMEPSAIKGQSPLEQWSGMMAIVEWLGTTS